MGKKYSKINSDVNNEFFVKPKKYINFINRIKNGKIKYHSKYYTFIGYTTSNNIIPENFNYNLNYDIIFSNGNILKHTLLKYNYESVQSDILRQYIIYANNHIYYIKTLYENDIDLSYSNFEYVMINKAEDDMIEINNEDTDENSNIFSNLKKNAKYTKLIFKKNQLVGVKYNA